MVAVGRGYYPSRQGWEYTLRHPGAAPPLHSGECERCGTYFERTNPGNPPKYCTERCSRQAHDSRRYHRLRATVYETFNSREIYERDGWECGLCRLPTDIADFTIVTGSDGKQAHCCGPDFPTLDHIIPITRGGPHTRANVQTAHHLCNTIKGNRV